MTNESDNWIFSTETVFPIEGKSFKTEENHKNLLKSLDNGEKRDIEIFIGDERFFTPIPNSHFLAIACTIAILSPVLNTLVFAFYRNSKSNTRSYILALVLMDFSCILFVLVPSIISLLIENEDITLYIKVTYWFVGSILINSSFCPSLLLAFDRCLVVTIPHKFQLYWGKLRVFKCTLVAITTIVSFSTCLCELLIGLESAITTTLLVIRSVIWLSQLITALVLYFVMGYKIFKANKNASNMRQNSRLEKN